MKGSYLENTQDLHSAKKIFQKFLKDLGEANLENQDL